MRNSFGMLRLFESASLIGFSVALLAGCQTADNPYAYSYSARSGGELCLVRNPANSETAVLQLKAALREKGLSMREVRAAAFCEGACLRFATEGPTQMQIDRAVLSLEEGGAVKHRVHWEKQESTGLVIQDSTQAIQELVDRMFPEPTPWETR